MRKMILGALGALALCVSGLPAEAAPAIDAPIQAALYQADGSSAVVQTVQYRRFGYGVPPRRFYRPHRRFYRPPVRGFRGPPGYYRGPIVRPGYGRY